MGAQAATYSNFSFKDTDIKVVLQSISELAKSEGKDINIVPGPAVTGTVTIDLTQVDWETALDVILRTYNLDAYRQENVIMVNPIGPGGSVAKNEIHVKVFNLKYIDANDALKAITPILSTSGKTSVLQTTGQSGWEFGAGTPGTTQANTKPSTTDNKLKRTNVLVVSDSAERLDQITALIEQLDIMPKQILIKARILEVDYNLVKDTGLEWGTGSNGTVGFVNSSSGSQIATGSIASVTPSTFIPQTAGLSAANSGFQFAFKQLSGTQYEIVLHALEEKTGTNTLSAPILTTLNNQEASILVGEQFPITQTTVSDVSNDVIGGSLQYYQDIGIKLNVIPQVWGEKQNYINMIIHPVVSSTSSSVDIIDGSTNTTLDQYPIIETQEAETQLVIPDNSTVMMGGLIKDIKSNQVVGVPFLSEIPYLGKLFSRTVKNTQKVELIIFITAHIMEPEEQVSTKIMDTKAVERHFMDKK
jgi:type IV pilus assembly protein PilQ